MTRRRMMERAEAVFARRKLPPAATAQPAVDTLPQVKHIVILMMENHSFDGHLGSLGPDRGGFDLANPPDPALHHRTGTRQLHHTPTQSWRGSHVQWNNGANDGFTRSADEQSAFAGVTDPEASSIATAFWTEAELPFYYSLAVTFPLCTRWFTPCLGPTFPNRRFLLAATANGLMDDIPALDTPAHGTILDMLSAQGISWRNYHNVPMGKVLLARLGGLLVLQLGRAVRMLAASVGPVREYNIGHLTFTADLYPAGLLRVRAHTASLQQFFADAAGALPAVSIVDPDFMHWSEENAQDIQVGGGFAAAIVQAVMDGPGWDGTVLVWLYDEHGGYYDHVPPPAAVPPDDVQAHSLVDRKGVTGALLKVILGKMWSELKYADDWPDRAYDRYGFRVPAVVVSPFAKRDCVTDTVFDHTSVLKFIEDKWGLPSLTRRDAAANSIIETLDFANPGFAGAKPVLAPPARPFAGLKDRRR